MTVAILDHACVGGFASYLFPQVRPLQGDHANVDRVCYEGLVVHELVGGEGRHRVQEELGSLLEVSDGHTVQALVHLETIPPIPVSTFLDQTEQSYGE